MKKIKVAISMAASALFFAGALAQAQTETAAAGSSTTTSTTVQSTDSEPNTRFSVGLKSTQFYYTEPSMKDYGRLNGIAGSFFQRISATTLFRLDGEYLTGTTQYDGALQDRDGNLTPISTDDQRFRTFNISGDWIFRNFAEGPVAVCPVLGLGYRDTYDNKDNVYDYRRDNTYIYGLFGLQIEAKPTANILLLFKLEQNLLISGQNKTYLSDAGDYPDLQLRFHDGSASKVAVEMYYTLKNKSRIQTEISYTAWRIGDSEKYLTGDGHYWVEPSNETKLTSLTLGYLF